MKEAIEQAVEILKKGGVILYPTDTVWGIGCDATNADAVERIYALKQSQGKCGMIILVDKLDNMGRYFNRIPDVAADLIEVNDKPMTLILPGACGVAENLIAEDGSLGIRIPNHEFCRAVISRLKRPIVSTSANISGMTAPLSSSEVSKVIKEGVDYIVANSCEGSPTRKASSIIKIGAAGEIEIIRN